MTDATFSNSDKTSAKQQKAVSQQASKFKDLQFSDLNSEVNAASFDENLTGQETDIDPDLQRLQLTITDAELTGGDPDDDAYQASVVGEEAIGGQTPTPDQNVTEGLQKAVGITATDSEPVRTAAKLDWCDQHHWQLNPESSEDYQDRLEL